MKQSKFDAYNKQNDQTYNFKLKDIEMMDNKNGQIKNKNNNIHNKNLSMSEKNAFAGQF